MSLKVFHATLPFIKVIKIPQWIWLHKKQCKTHIYHVTKDLANATELLKLILLKFVVLTLAMWNLV